MSEKTFTVPRISCGHCVNAIKEELSELEGVESVNGDPAKKQVSVQFSAPATEEAIRAALKNMNYPAEG